MTTEALVPAAAEPAVVTAGGGEIVLPQVIVDAGPAAVARFLEFFAGRIANARTRAAYGRAVGQFLGWCEARGLRLRDVSPLHVAAYIRTHLGSVPTVKQHLGHIRYPPLKAEAGGHARCRNTRLGGGVRFAARPRPEAGTVRGSMPGAQRQFGNGDGIPLTPKKATTIVPLPPLEDGTTRASMARRSCDPMRQQQELAAFTRRKPVTFHDVGVSATPIMRVWMSPNACRSASCPAT